MSRKKIMESFYIKRKENSLSKIKLLRNRMEGKFSKNITIFVVGSLGREEVGEKSDLDLFIISTEEISNLEKYKTFALLMEIAEELGFPEFSNDGQYLTIHTLDDLKKFTGSPFDDSQNLFTARMLMLLEGKVLFNEKLFKKVLSQIVAHYLRDKKGNKDFKPYFLLNDILRYWRTLCLNYEVIRQDKDRPWRKKNVNLKYSRLVTVFSTVFYLVTVDNITKKKILFLCKKTPLERILLTINTINDDNLYKKYYDLLAFYKVFLEAKEQSNIEGDFKKKEELNDNAEQFSDIISFFLDNKKIDKKMKKFLVV